MLTEWTLTYSDAYFSDLDFGRFVQPEGLDKEESETADRLTFQGGPGSTLKEAQEFVETNRLTGVTCPCCGQTAKTYRKRLGSTRAVGLVLLYWLYQKHPECRGKFVHVVRYIHSLGLDPKISALLTGDFVGAKNWGMLEAGARVGYWRLSQRAIDFIEGRVSIPSYAYLFNDELLGHDHREMIDIYEALDGKFDLRGFEMDALLRDIEKAESIDELADLERRIQGRPDTEALSEALYARLDEISSAPMAA